MKAKLTIREELLRYADNGKHLDKTRVPGIIFCDIAEADEVERQHIDSFIVGLIDTETKPVSSEDEIMN